MPSMLLSKIISLLLLTVAFSAIGCGIATAETWSFDVVDSGYYVGVDTNSLVLDDSGNPHIAYYTWDSYDLKYAYNDGTSWIIQTVDSAGQVGKRCDLTLDSQNRPHISYYDITNSAVKYAWYDGINWQNEVIETGNRAHAWSSIGIDSKGKPHIIYIYSSDFNFYFLKYAWKDESGVWQKVVLDGGKSPTGWYNSLVLDQYDNLHISYLKGYDELKYAHYNGNQWFIETVDSTGVVETSIAVDSTGRPAIAYHGSGETLRYAYKNGLSWVIQIIEDRWCSLPSLTFDSKDHPHISYFHYDAIYGIRYAYYDGQSWNIQFVESGATPYYYSSIALDKNDKVFVSYSWNNDLKLASISVINPDKIPPVTNTYLNGVPSLETWYAREVHVQFFANDKEGGSGVQNIYYSIDGTNWIIYTGPFVINTEGLVTLSFYSVDNAGNEEEPQSLQFNIDRTPPVTTCALDGVLGDSNWYVSNVTVTLSATDNEGGSGVKKTEYSFDGEEWITYTEPFIVSAEGLTKLYYRSEDNAGIIEVTIVREDVKIDTVAPVTTETHTGTPTTGYSVSFSSSGGSSTQYSYDGITWEEYEQPLLLETEGTWTVYYRTIDDAGNQEQAQCIDIIIDKTPPTITGIVTPSPNENGWYRTDVTVHFDASDAISGLESVTPDITLTSDGEDQSVTGTATDSAGNSASCTVDGINIDKTPPIVNSIAFTLEPYPINSLLQVNAPYTEVNPDKAIINWGDGSPLEDINLREVTDGMLLGSHSYVVPGIYTVEIAVFDLAGNSGSLSSSEYVVIFDPNGGFVTGGGWISSPLGAYTLDTSLSGKATFGFVSKYLKGATVPTGQTEFQFRVANLNFHSESYDWLVVAGPKAQFKGVGTINGEGNYGFMLTAIDGQLNGGGGIDKFRIKIWDKISDDVVYDNQIEAEDDAYPTTIIGGGSIVIHSK